jgi:hypothetical protein
MSEAILSGRGLLTRKSAQPARDVTLPKPQPFGTPVFITDAVTPLAGETVLSLLMKRMMAEPDGDSP